MDRKDARDKSRRLHTMEEVHNECWEPNEMSATYPSSSIAIAASTGRWRGGVAMDVARDNDVCFARRAAQQMAHCFGVDPSHTFAVHINYLIAHLQFSISIKVTND